MTLHRWGGVLVAAAALVVALAGGAHGAARVAFNSRADYSDTRATFTQGQTVYARILDHFDTPGTNYVAEWRDPANALLERDTCVYQGGPYSDSYALDTGATLGTWESSMLHNPNFGEWSQIVYLEPTTGNILEGALMKFRFYLVDRNGDTIAGDQSANMELYLFNEKAPAILEWSPTSQWTTVDPEPFRYDPVTNCYSCTWTSTSSKAKGGLFGVRYTPGGVPESGDDYRIRVTNIIAFRADSPLPAETSISKLLFLPCDAGPDTAAYPTHFRFGAGNPIRLRWQAYQCDYTTLDTTALSLDTVCLMESSDYNPATGQDTASSDTSYLAGPDYSYKDLDGSAFNAGKYRITIAYHVDKFNFSPVLGIDVFFDGYDTFTVQAPPLLAYDGSLTNLISSPPGPTAVPGDTAQFQLALINNGGVDLPMDTPLTLALGDGTDTSLATMTAAETIVAGGTVLVTFNAAVVSSLIETGAWFPQVTVQGTDANGQPYAVTIIISDSILVAADTGPPDAPVGLTITAETATVDSGIYLQWDPNDEPDTLGYNVYCDTDADGNWEPVSGLLTDTTAFLYRAVVPGETYVLCVTCVNQSIQESGHSDTRCLPIFLAEKILAQCTLGGNPTPARPGATIEWRVRAGNRGFGPAAILIIGDTVMPGTAYQPNSADTESGYGYTAAIDYSHDSGATWDGSQAAPVTNIRWIVAGTIATDSVIEVKYQAIID